MDEIRVTMPSERPFGAVAGLVLGGVAARHALTIDVLDDLQLALESLLERDTRPREITLVLRVGPETVEASVGPFARAALAELELDNNSGRGLDLRRLLDTVVDAVDLADRDDGCWVELRKNFQLAGRA
jgi:hypothetical protein